MHPLIGYAFDYDTRAFIGLYILSVQDADPRSPGSFLLPGNVVRRPPPKCSPGFHPFWIDGHWFVKRLPKPEAKTTVERVKQWTQRSSILKRILTRISRKRSSST